MLEGETKLPCDRIAEDKKKERRGQQKHVGEAVGSTAPPGRKPPRQGYRIKDKRKCQFLLAKMSAFALGPHVCVSTKFDTKAEWKTLSQTFEVDLLVELLCK